MKSHVLVIVGQRIREIRKERGMTQEELGESAGFHFSYIGGVERAEKNISITNLEKISIALSCKLSDLLIYESENNNSKTEKEKLVNDILMQLIPLSNKSIKQIHNIVREIINNS